MLSVITSITYLAILTGHEPVKNQIPLPYFTPRSLVLIEKTGKVISGDSCLVPGVFPSPNPPQVNTKDRFFDDLDRIRIVLAFVESNKVENLKRMGLNCQVLDYSLPFDESWLVTAEKKDLNKIRAYGKILAFYRSTVQRILSCVSFDTVCSLSGAVALGACSQPINRTEDKCKNWIFYQKFHPYSIPSDVYDVRFICPKAWLADGKGDT